MLKPVGVTVASALLSGSEELYELFFGDRDNPFSDDDGALLENLERPIVENIDEQWLQPENEIEEDLMEVFTEGSLLVSDGVWRLTYTEQDSEDNRVKTVLSFHEDTPGSVSMCRTGAINTTFLFDEGKRTKCIYSLPFGAMDFTIFTLFVDNRLATENKLVLDYCLEIRGSSLEHRRVSVTLTERTPLSVPREQPLDGTKKL